MGHFHLLMLKGMIFPLPRGKCLTVVRGHDCSPLKEVKCPLPVRNKGISSCILSINSLKKSFNIKDWENEKPRGEENPHFIKQKIHEFNGNEYLPITLNFLTNLLGNF